MSTIESQVSESASKLVVIVRCVVDRREDGTVGLVGELIGYTVGRKNPRSIMRVAGESDHAFYDRVVEAEKQRLVGNNGLMLLEIRE
jgi:hypothetical protein